MLLAGQLYGSLWDLFFIGHAGEAMVGMIIYYCDKQGDSWSKPVNAGSTINTFGDEKFPSVDSAGNLYFSSNGYQGFGGMDYMRGKKSK